MDHREMVDLIRPGVLTVAGIWADLGAGSGNFTWALAELLGPEAQIYAIDRDMKALHALQQRMQQELAPAHIIPQQRDLHQRLDLPMLHGLLMANLLHFMRDQASFLQSLLPLLRPGGSMLIVEYEQEHVIPWVPYPLPFARLEALALQLQLEEPRRVGLRRSASTGQSMYAALCRVA
jgi:ubiquinone/menaquinone biosynthesis C-methylase UbiE